MSGPAITRTTAQGTLGWRDRIVAQVRLAGKAGTTSAEVALAIGHKLNIVVTLMSSYRATGHLWCQREGRGVRYFHTATVPVGEGAQPLTPEERRANRARLAALRVNTFCERPSNGPVMPRAVPTLQAATKVVGGVPVTTCKPLLDTRFVVDPATFKGGAFMAEWRRLRRGGAR